MGLLKQPWHGLYLTQDTMIKIQLSPIFPQARPRQKRTIEDLFLVEGAAFLAPLPLLFELMLSVLQCHLQGVAWCSLTFVAWVLQLLMSPCQNICQHLA